MLFTFEEFAAAVALAHPLPGPVASALVSPSPSYTLLSGVTSPSSLPTELSLPTSWAEQSPSPIDYEGISEWAEEAAEADPPAPPLFAVFPQVPEGPAALFILENPAPLPGCRAGPVPTRGAVASISVYPHPVFEEQLLPTPQSPAPISPHPLSPLPAEEEAHLENQENIPPVVAGPIFARPPCVDTSPAPPPVFHSYHFVQSGVKTKERALPW
ncbi:hypothetical protein BJV77DRAFT_1073500 [Russula vinacea]|nr:hypothetical protein BJV77DRAFT_1073500 [Russula vinacea]